MTADRKSASGRDTLRWNVSGCESAWAIVYSTFSTYGSTGHGECTELAAVLPCEVALRERAGPGATTPGIAARGGAAAAGGGGPVGRNCGNCGTLACASGISWLVRRRFGPGTGGAALADRRTASCIRPCMGHQACAAVTRERAAS